MFLRDLGRQQVADDLLGGVLPLDPVGQHLVERHAHTQHLERGHHLQDFMAFH